mmetsp:Transcript_33120/g.72159  ORF Transcript_33120/g.72159 Transcript_33120/m.72159 type:complete len:300 (+) Transcript_33120:94-993(+)|eukprot:CAMPEP_0170599828 /NCGR_PEP_ID=MMETSP0224-20130122/17010_1 /TAXON_ID=285029 /ORGANISM="Togula jolla, Strain CCCM 725" /LENGTH=299 /DNA_ID=CAMNT_0010924515 /DNA_START=89 /DNA_END=988 /DNA_ORIENTATION=+
MAMQNFNARILRELAGKGCGGSDWLECEDSFGIFYYSRSMEKAVLELPSEVLAEDKDKPVASAQHNVTQATILMRVGKWILAEDDAGIFCQNTLSLECYDEPPEELLLLFQEEERETEEKRLRQQHEQQQQIQQERQLQLILQQQNEQRLLLSQKQQGQQRRLLHEQDEQQLRLLREQSGPQLRRSQEHSEQQRRQRQLALRKQWDQKYGQQYPYCSPQRTQPCQPCRSAPLNPSQEAIVKMRVGSWAVAQDHLGEFYQNTETGECFESPPPEFLLLLEVRIGTTATQAGFNMHVNLAA